LNAHVEAKHSGKVSALWLTLHHYLFFCCCGIYLVC
jgi:hypothetical protein